MLPIGPLLLHRVTACLKFTNAVVLDVVGRRKSADERQ